MTEKTLKQSQSDMLHTLRAEFRLEKSVETALYNFLVDDEGEVLSNQEFLEVLRAFDNWVVNKDRQPTLAVGEYYLDKDVNRIVKIENHETGYTEIVYLSDGKLLRSVLYNLEDYFEKWNPATAEQIATFRRAEHFASKGRKLDEFRVGDRVMDERGKVFTVTHITNGYLFYNTEIIDSVMKAKLIKIMEDKNEI